MSDESQIHKGHRARMKSRFEMCGLVFDSFHEHEILEMMLFFCFSRRNTNDIAHNLLSKFGSLENVVSAPVEELCKVKYISTNSAAVIKMFGALADSLEKSDSRTDDLL